MQQHEDTPSAPGMICAAFLDNDLCFAHICDGAPESLAQNPGRRLGRPVAEFINVPSPLPSGGYLAPRAGGNWFFLLTPLPAGAAHAYALFAVDSARLADVCSSRRRLENHLMKSALDSLYDGVIISDTGGHIRYYNEAFARISGINSLEELLGLPMRESMPYLKIVTTCTQKVFESKKQETIIMQYATGKKGLVTASPVFYEGELVRVVSLVRDISELNTLHEKLAAADALNQGYQRQLQEMSSRLYQGEALKTRDKKMDAVYARAIKAAAIESPVLIQGETGVGKDHLAKFIHEHSASAKNGPFIIVNCGAIPDQLFESELFGYAPGAFSGALRQGRAGLFEVAGSGTLFLDEIGEIPRHLQVKLLNVLQNRSFYRLGESRSIPFQARVIAATNANLGSLMEQGAFRKDLYYRLNVLNIHIPPLRDRQDDIIPLALDFLAEFNSLYKRDCAFSQRVLTAFLHAPWPGNIRELRNTVERLVVTAENSLIQPEDLQDSPGAPADPTTPAAPPPSPARSQPGRSTSLKDRLDDLEAEVIRDALHRHGCMMDAAAALGIDLSTLSRKRRKHGIN